MARFGFGLRIQTMIIRSFIGEGQHTLSTFSESRDYATEWIA